jgi:phosphatidylserine/phosphatidylglycerophosphate/cardiolipin synthase-like enzyme
MRRFALLFAAFLGGCAFEAGDEGSSTDDVTTDAAMTSLVGSAKTIVYANVKSTASKALSTALITAAHSGVEVHVILKEGSHDTTWQLQQTLEANGVDCDVMATSTVTGVTMIADKTALVGSSKKTATTAQTSAFAQAFVGDKVSAGALITSGVRVLPMPDKGRDRIVQVFGAAKKTIDLSIYALQERGVVASLEGAAKRGVTVRVMLEPKTVGGSNEAPIAKELTAAGITVQTTPPNFDASHDVDHAKFAIIDGKELLLGTGNMVRSGLGGVTDDVYANRDFWIEDARGTQIGEAQRVFDADWARTSTNASSVPDLVVTPDNADQEIGALIDGAKTRLYVYNQSLSDSDLTTRIIAAHKRGVDVRVLLGYQPAFGGQPPNAPAISQLSAAGIDAQYLKKHYLHAKAIVADGEVYLGSQNFTNGGLHNNREMGEILSDATSVSTVVTTFEADAQ